MNYNERSDKINMGCCIKNMVPLSYKVMRSQPFFNNKRDHVLTKEDSYSLQSLATYIHAVTIYALSNQDRLVQILRQIFKYFYTQFMCLKSDLSSQDQTKKLYHVSVGIPRLQIICFKGVQRVFQLSGFALSLVETSLEGVQ